VALAFVDLDGFKLVNDGLGHKAGDELLKVVSKRMGACLRRNDTLARFGGDEFVILLPDQSHDPQALAPLLEKIRVAVTEPIEVAGQAVQVSCSMGVVMYPRDGADASALLMNADAAMYRAKDLGSNNFQFYAREMNASVEEKLVLLDGLRNAVQATFEGRRQQRLPPAVPAEGRPAHRQPVRGRGPDPLAASGARHGAAAALHRPGRRKWMIVEIGDWVVREACRQARAWADAGLPPVTMSVNVSARQFEESSLVDRVACALRDSRLAPELLELEVTESLIMRDLQKSVAKMRELEAMGVSLSIDDFGTGYSSLSSLKTFPISRLKIDKIIRERTGRQPGRPGDRDGGDLARPQAEPARDCRRRRDRAAARFPARERVRRDAGVFVQQAGDGQCDRRYAGGVRAGAGDVGGCFKRVRRMTMPAGDRLTRRVI
jgi:diguanylate cyclase (GGDEF)-like protein